MIACTFQWVQDGVCHELGPAAARHRTGTDRLKVSELMLAGLREFWDPGTGLGHVTQERTHAYTLRRADPHSSSGIPRAGMPH